MGFPFQSKRSAKLDQIIAIDLGTRVTKAVYLVRKNGSLALAGYTLQDTPVSEKKISRQLLSDHLRSIVQALNARTRRIVLVTGVGDSLICHAEMPKVDRSDMRKMVRLNSKTYFQEELPQHAYDCFLIADQTDAGGKSTGKVRTLIGAARADYLEELEESARDAGLVVEEITLGHLGPANAFLAAPPEGVKGAAALVGLGFTNSTVSILLDGELRLTRVVNLGADALTRGLAEALNITYPVAEGLKQIMPDKVQSKLQSLLAPLARELQTSIDFFEHQLEQTVSEIFVSGGSARSAFIVQILQSELGIPCKVWDPTSSLQVDLPLTQQSKVKDDAPQLGTAISAGIGALEEEAIRIDLLAEKHEAELLRRRDPVKWSYLGGAFVVALLLVWASHIRSQINEADAAVDRHMSTLKGLQALTTQVAVDSRNAGDIERTLAALDQLRTNRFNWAPVLEALKFTVVDDIQVVKLKTDQSVFYSPAVRAITNDNVIIPAKPAILLEKNTITIQAKDFADPPAAEKFMETIKAYPWFRQNLRKTEPIRLKDRFAPQVDPSDPTKTFILFTVECFCERSLQ